MKYFETVITVRVLSTNEPFGEGMSLAAMNYAISEGNCMGQLETAEEKELTGPEMAQRALDFGGDPGFFFLNDEGNETEN